MATKQETIEERDQEICRLKVIIKDMYSISEYKDMKSKLEREIADYKREVSAMRENIEYIRGQNNVYERLLFDDNKQEIDGICN